jgi:hypothetical protein
MDVKKASSMFLRWVESGAVSNFAVCFNRLDDDGEKHMDVIIGGEPDVALIAGLNIANVHLCRMWGDEGEDGFEPGEMQ